MEQYDKALMEGVVSPTRLAKKRMKAFTEAVSEVAPRELVEAVVDAHNALFEGGHVQFGQFPNGTRYSTSYNKKGGKLVVNGNDAVANDEPVQPPTGANVIYWHKQNPQGSAALKHYENIAAYAPRPRIVPREEPANYNMRYDDSWERQMNNTARQMPPPPPPQMEEPQMVPPQAVRQHAPQPEPPKQECPPVCPEPPKAVEKPVDTETKKAPAPEKKKPTAPPYKWKDTDFDPIQGEQCSTTHPYVVNLVSYSSNNPKTAAYQAKHEFDEGVKGVYIYQFDGQAHNSTRKDVWRVRIGFFKSRAAARTYVIRHVKDRDQFKWWIAKCDAQNSSGDKMKPNTFKLAENITVDDCIDTSSSKKPNEQPVSNNTQQPANNTAPTKTEHKTLEGLLT